MGDVILVGTDFSENARLAVEEARGLADRLTGTLELVHVVEGYGSGAWAPGDLERGWLEAQDLGMDRLVVRRGVAWVELIRRATESGARAIVLGSHGTAGYQPLSLGSTAGRLALRSPVPVMLVTPKSARQLDHRALETLNGSSWQP